MLLPSPGVGGLYQGGVPSLCVVVTPHIVTNQPVSSPGVLQGWKRSGYSWGTPGTHLPTLHHP